ncbi:rhomboid family intramembrane serine protease [Flavobacterium collinsii]|jgi:membrane associated rhomboid family serine protease|uniref:Rhomboid family protein n=1 Tax=Flavobacterium collinsii TaxID=1114861 RepID=A0A9W4X1K1_9FLAO|nr:rhomboid family intramembrane serine protease [Flavobacterium collinsii]GIQ58467.1 rhomboid family intramembrane serine protease [Flavobacterium collinsii]CAA9194928.1 Rhomboid protease GlpG [Flavobacterium collinsii]CAI2765297.1 Rhomboid family protein [Flavobacterium collinsii]
MMKITPVVKQLLIINIIFFIGSQLVPVSYEYLALFFPENPGFKFWQPLTHMFMHGGFAHIAFNMFALYSFGSTLEHFWGGKKFLFFYISCGLGAALVNFAVNYYFYQDGLNILLANGFNKADILALLNEGKIDTRWQQILSVSEFKHLTEAYLGTVVGASGAVYGLLIAFTFMFPNAELGIMFIPIPIKAKYFVPVYMLLFDGFFGIFGSSFLGIESGVAHYAHIGGALFGFLIMWYWKKNQFNKNRWN